MARRICVYVCSHTTPAVSGCRRQRTLGSMVAVNENAVCPCGSGERYAVCCQPFHQGAREPPTPEALMRSRYSAFALKQVDHLVRTLHSTHADRQPSAASSLRALKTVCNRRMFPRLEILKVEPVDETGAAFVTFHATVMEKGRDVGFTERSEFRQEQGGWRYLRGSPG